MTSYRLIPLPPPEVAEDVFLYCVGGLTHLTGTARLAPPQRPECLMVFATHTGNAVVRAPQGVFQVQSSCLLTAPTGSGTLEVRAARDGESLSCVWALLGGALPLRLLALRESETTVAAPTAGHNPVDGLLRALWQTAKLGGAADGYWGSSQAYSLLMKLRAQAARSVQSLPPLVESAAALIRTDFAYLGGVEDVAERLGVSKSHLIRCFSEHMGTTPGKYLTQTRIEHAKLLLQSGHYKLEAVAGMVGIAGANYFCKLFKAQVGLTPSAYATVILRVPTHSNEPDPRFYL